MADLTYEQIRALADEVEREVYLDNGRVVGGFGYYDKQPAPFGPGITHRYKTFDEQLRDTRQAKFLDRLSALSTPGQLMRMRGGIELGDRLGKYNTNQGSYRDALRNDWEDVGWLGPGSALHTIGTYMSALPGAAYGTAELAGQALGDAVERATAPNWLHLAPAGSSWANKTPHRDVERSLNTLAAPLTWFAIADDDFQPDESYWAMQRHARKHAAGEDWKMLRGMEERAASRFPELASMPLQGQQYLERWGASPPVAMLAGLVSDTMLDPFSAAIPAAKVARGAKYFPAADRSAQVWKGRKMLAGDYAIGGALTGYGALDELLRNSDQQKNRITK